MNLDFSSWAKAGTANRAVGLDIGASSVKIVQVKKAGKGVKITGVYSAEIPRDDGSAPTPKSAGETAKKLIAENRINMDHCVSSFPLSSAILRNIVVPFAGTGKIRQVIKFQVEPHIPFPVEDVVVDFYETGADEADKTGVIIVSAQKELIAKHLEMLSFAGVDPEEIGLDAFALFNSFLFRAGDGGMVDEMAALAELGATRTLLVLVKGGKVLLARSIAVGGDDLTEAVQKGMGVDFTAAETLKRERGGALPPGAADEDAGKIHHAMAPVLARLVSEIERSLRSASATLKRETLSRIYLSGGCARLAGMRDYFSKEFGCETLYLSSPASLEAGSGDEDIRGMEIAAGLALQGIGRGKTKIDFRKEEYAHTGPRSRIRRQLIVAGALGLCAAALGLYGFFTSFMKNRNEYRLLSSRLEQVYSETFPGDGGVSAASVLPRMEQKLKAYQDMYNNFTSLSENSISSLEILREISARMPLDLKAQVTDLSIRQGNLEIEGLVNNPADADRIKKALEDSDYFSSVTAPSTSAYEGNQYKFKLVAELRGQAGV